MKKADRLGQDRVHDLALCLDTAVPRTGFISGTKSVNVTMPRDLFVRLRNSVDLLDYGIDADEAFDVKREKHHHARSHLEKLRRLALAVQYAIALSERDDKRAVIADEIGRGRLATIGRDGVSYTPRTIQKIHAEWRINWTKYDLDRQQAMRLFLDIVERELREFYEI